MADSLTFQLDSMKLTSLALRLTLSSCQLMPRTTNHKTSLSPRETLTSLSLLKPAPSSCHSMIRTTSLKTSPLLRETETNSSLPKPQPSQLTLPLFNKPLQATSTLLTKRLLTLL